MERHNRLFATFFGIIAFGSFVGALAGAHHQAFVCLIALFMVIIMLADNKKKTTV
ncbi:MAG TPA: hypothetical protein VGK38_07665 [Prolixibacteraceae bacterium]